MYGDWAVCWQMKGRGTIKNVAGHQQRAATCPVLIATLRPAVRQCGHPKEFLEKTVYPILNYPSHKPGYAVPTTSAETLETQQHKLVILTGQQGNSFLNATNNGHHKNCHPFNRRCVADTRPVRYVLTSPSINDNNDNYVCQRRKFQLYVYSKEIAHIQFKSGVVDWHKMAVDHWLHCHEHSCPENSQETELFSILIVTRVCSRHGQRFVIAKNYLELI